ncbi:DNA/RNA non-specific endonuclease [Streptomyces sp. GMY02]|uniref:DUF6531 domain-containing protein n=1 Tax=Streptomyces sp. GMY02 TaxID=1333528 RepID=UPI001C2BF1C2|nr:DUF6531 domain-containing protein [Streptomyces sp. GMY02]QXE35643.1 DNA/RNA non-specific endonuclease [Streptomyces sp. GMY02]
MAVTVPEWADVLLDLIGVSWPNVDEDAYRDMADALREFAEDLEDDGQLANNHVQRLISSGHGEALDALNGHWGKVKDKHISDIASAARTIAGALDTAATAIEVMKGAAIVQLGYLAAEAGIALSLIPVTGGLSALFGAAAIRATQEVVRRLIREAADEAVGYIVAAMTEPAVAALENLAADLVVQLGATAMGLQDGVDLGQARQAGTDGFREGVQGSKDAMHLASAGGGDSGGGAGGGRGSGPGFHIEHAEHDFASTQLNGVSVSIHGKTAGKLTKARTAHGRTRGRDSIAEVIDPLADKAMEALEKAVRTMGDHVGQTLPQAVRRISDDHRNNDDDIRARLARERNDRDGAGSTPVARNGGRRAESDTRTRANAVREARDDARRNSVSLEKTICKNDPVDVATGEMLLPQTDLSLPGVLPLVLRRTHVSAYRYGHWFGRSWASTLDERVELDPVGGGAVWAREDGSLLVYPRLPRAGGDPVLPLEGDRLPLVHGGEDGDVTTYLVVDPHSGVTRSFTGSPYRSSPAFWLSELSDRNDNRVSFSRRPDGAPTTVTHTGGYTVRLTADMSRVTALALRVPEGPVTLLTYGYDAAGDLTDLIDASGSPMRFTYDAESRVTSWTDRNLSTFRYVYDPHGRVVRTVGPDGCLSSTFAYGVHAETGQRVTRYTDSTGATTVLHLDDRLQVVAETDPLGNTTLHTWDAYDRPLTRTDPLGHTTELTWDEAGNLAAVRFPDGGLATARYNGLNLPVEITDADGAVWRQTFDELGNCTSTCSPDGAVTRLTHDRTGAVASITDALGSVTRIRADRAGLPVEITDARSAVTRVERDHQGRPTRVVDAAAGVESFEWDVEDRLLARIAPDGSRESWDWDGEGNCLAHTDTHGGVTTTEYGPFDKPVARTAADGARYELRYDTELRLVQVTNPLGHKWDYTYDRAGHLDSEADFDGRETRYTYDAAGRLVSRTAPLGRTVNYTWDAMDRLLTKEVAGPGPEDGARSGAVTRYDYSPGGMLLGAVSATSTLTVERDPLGRPVAETVDGRTSRYTYDLLGRRVSRTTPAGAVTRFAYSAEGDRVSVATGGHALSFTHDLLGRELSRSWGAPGTPVVLTTAWDTRSRPAGQSLITAEGTVLYARDYGYRADNHLVSVADLTSGTRHEKRVSLDPLGRPLAVTAPGWTESYVYDAAGNQTAAHWPGTVGRADARGDRAYDGGQLVSAGSVHYAYDGAGRVVRRRRTRLSKKPDTWRYTYDTEDRLVSCTTPDGTQWRYSYDPLGRRTAKHRMAADGQAAVETVHFTWDGNDVAEQTDSATGTILTWEYEGHRPLLQYERKPLGADETDARFFAIVTDLVGTPTELISEAGETAWRSHSACWGTTAWHAGATAYTPLRFPGQYADPETGLHYNHFRHYDPATARYTSTDPLGLAPAPNPSTYVLNPWTWTDPLGLAPKVCKQDAYAWDGSIRYGRLDHLGRPTGVHAQLRPEMLRTGTPAGTLRPPGWRGNGDAFNEARGHLLADRLGGAGKGRLAFHNLVTQTNNPTNSPEQRDQVEQKIFDAVAAGEIVQYVVKPVYEGTNPIPVRLEYTAFGNRGFTLTHSLDNPAAGVRTGV